MQNTAARMIQLAALCLSLLGGVSNAGVYSGGDGTAEAPYLIAAPEDLLELSNEANSADRAKHFQMANDIDMRGVANFTPIGLDEDYTGEKRFTGVFDGGGHAIQGLTIDFPEYSYVGLFSVVVLGGEVRNLGLENPVITGGSRSVGALAGSCNAAVITNCYASDVLISCAAQSSGLNLGGLVGAAVDSNIDSSYVTGAVLGDNVDNVGGLVGWQKALEKECIVSNCWAVCIVRGEKFVGGLAGRMISWHPNDFDTFYNWEDGTCHWSESIVRNCFSAGAVMLLTTYGRAGGLAGATSGGTVQDCYSAARIIRQNSGEADIGGLIGREGPSGDFIELTESVDLILEHPSTITASFWDVEASRLSVSAAGTGWPTAQMQQQSAFTAAGWDFEAVWAMPAAGPYRYPVLKMLPTPDLSALHDADTQPDFVISLSELLRFIQFFNTGAYHTAEGIETEDGYMPGENLAPGATPHTGDYLEPYWQISLHEVLRLIQLFNSGHYYPCASAEEDGFCL